MQFSVTEPRVLYRGACLPYEGSRIQWKLPSATSPEHGPSKEGSDIIAFQAATGVIVGRSWGECGLFLW
jgi:hypothetical protein